MIISRKRISSSASLWDQLPTDVWEIIFGKLWTGDRVRLRLVCKSWTQILNQPSIPTAPEAPWEILSDDSYNNPQPYITQICFRSLSENRKYRFDLPILCDAKSNRGWLCAYSRGWLVLANLNLDVFLWNPLSGATRKLPPLSTLPFFRDVQEFAGVDINIQNIPNIIHKVEIFSIGSIEHVVAALFNTSGGKKMALCTPRQVNWTPVNVEPVVEGEKEVDIKFEDILFQVSGGKLVALVIDPFFTVIGQENFEAQKFTISLPECQVQLVPTLVPREQGNATEAQPPFGFKINAGSTMVWRLVESSIMHNVMSFAAKFETFVSSKDKGLVPKFCCGQTTQLMGWTDRPPVYGKEATFIGGTGSFRLPVVPGILPDCIYFAFDNVLGLAGHGNNMKPYIVRESGKYVYDLQKKKKSLHRNPSRMIKYPGMSKIGWFMPKLFMF